MTDTERETTKDGGQMPTSDVLKSLIDSGLHEIERDRLGLVLSSFSAGLDIGFGPLLMAVVLTMSQGGFGDLGTELILAGSYSIGFVFVILGRSELFTEHTTLAVLPVLDGKATLPQLARLWGLVYLGNIIGGLVFASLGVLLLADPGLIAPEALTSIAHKMMRHDPGWLFTAAMFAGWLMGLLAWLLSAAQDTTSRLLLICLITATIGLLHLPHSIAGNVEVLFGLYASPSITVVDYLQFLGLATLGNAFGGAVFVAILKYGHVVRGAK